MKLINFLPKIKVAINLYTCQHQKPVFRMAKWLGAMFDYLNDHNATSKLAYVQIGNESDGDYAKKTVLHRSVTIRMIFTGQNTPIWWKNLTISSGQGRLKQNSHRVKWGVGRFRRISRTNIGIFIRKNR